MYMQECGNYQYTIMDLWLNHGSLRIKETDGNQVVQFLESKLRVQEDGIRPKTISIMTVF